jgi:purine-binding chemotaxis protein CheW
MTHTEICTRSAVPFAAKYLTFRVADRTYGVPVLSVSGILSRIEFAGIALPPDESFGARALRNGTVDVVDLRRRLGLAEADRPRRVSVLFVYREGLEVGLVVDRVLEVRSLSAHQLAADRDRPVRLLDPAEMGLREKAAD